jgi:hypothetical protein
MALSGGRDVTLPTFLGIGVPRAGTTWLYELLASHPDIYVPFRRKEVRFFDRYFERGYHWYEQFFPPDEQAGRYQAIGEITPEYFYSTDCLERIANTPSVTRLILMLRNPIARAYSQYGLRVRIGKSSESFEDFLTLRPQAIEWGFYSRYLENYLHYFQREQILVLIFEHAVTDVSETKETLARFFGVAVDRFPPTAGTKRVNRSYAPKGSRFVRYLFHKIGWELVRFRWNQDWIINLAGRLGIERLFGDSGSPPPMKEETRQYLRERYEDEIRELESLLQEDLTCWK